MPTLSLRPEFHLSLLFFSTPDKIIVSFPILRISWESWFRPLSGVDVVHPLFENHEQQSEDA
jgi:hypothetical protein